MTTRSLQSARACCSRSTGFIQIVNAAANRDFVFQGSGFTYGASGVLTGIISAFQETTYNLPQTPLIDFTGNVQASPFYADALLDAAGNHQPFSDLTSSWSIVFTGNAGNDVFGSGDGNDAFKVSGGNDFFDGGSGIDRANYTHAPGPVDVDLGLGAVTKWADANRTISAGSDTLRSIELVTGTDSADTFYAVDFVPGAANVGSNGGFNEFEGRGGNDVITGNGSTRISYLHALGR